VSYLEFLLNIERNDARFFLVLVFCNEDALDDIEGGAEAAEAVEWRCLKSAGK
jgi:hypothetical protein